MSRFPKSKAALQRLKNTSKFSIYTTYCYIEQKIILAVAPKIEKLLIFIGRKDLAYKLAQSYMNLLKKQIAKQDSLYNQSLERH